MPGGIPEPVPLREQPALARRRPPGVSYPSRQTPHPSGRPRMPTPTRRAFLQVGGSTAVGLGLADVLAGRAAAAPARPKSVVIVLLTGGMSHLDTLDLKPDAPAEVRGEFGSIPTAV